MATEPRRTRSRTRESDAGQPARTGQARAERALAPDAGPSQEELDLRDQLKSGPRKQAGPPLTGDTPTEERIRALRNEEMPEETDPTDPESDDDTK